MRLFLTVHPRHSQKRIFDAFRCFAAHFCSLNGAPFIAFWTQILMRAWNLRPESYE